MEDRPGIGGQTFKIQLNMDWLCSKEFTSPLLDLRCKAIYTEIDTRDVIMIADINGREDKIYLDKTILNDLLDYR